MIHHSERMVKESFKTLSSDAMHCFPFFSSITLSSFMLSEAT